MKIIFLLFFLTVGTVTATHAEPGANSQTLLTPALGGESPVEIHGFASQGFLQSTNNNYLPDSKNGTTDFADAGLTVNKMLTNNLRAGAQLFARDFGRTGNYNAKFDWFLLDYHWKDWLGLRAGRVKIPYGLYNETNDIDTTRASIFIPQSVYPVDQRDYLLAQTGFNFYGFVDLSRAGALDYNLYRGTLQITPTNTPGAPMQLATSDVPYVQGGRLIWETPLKGLRLAGSYQMLLYKADVYIPSLSKTMATDIKVSMGVGSLEYSTRLFQFSTEYARWWEQLETSLPAVLPSLRVTSERYYGMASFRATEWLHPGIYHALTFPDNRSRDQPKDFLKETAVFCRLDLTPNWILKTEWHYMDGTTGLSSSMNSGKSLNAMSGYWQMFMLKTTVFF